MTKPRTTMPASPHALWVPSRGKAFKIALGYALLGVLWIVCSGWVLHAFVRDPALAALLETVKGWFFVGVTALLLGLVLDRYFREIRRSAQRVQEGEAERRRWADAFEHCAHGIAIGLPESNRIMACNPAMARLLGRTVDQVSGSRVLDLYPPGDHERILSCLAEADRVGHGRHESAMLRADGTTVPVQIDVVSVRGAGGALLYRVATAQDITHRRQAEAAVRSSEAFTKAIFDSIDARIAVLDRHGVITAVNLPWIRTANENPTDDGRPARNCGVGTNYLEVCRNAARETAEAKAAYDGIQAVIEGRLPCFTLEYTCHTPTRKGWGSMMVTPLGLTEGGVVISHTTVTDRKEAEEALRQGLLFRRQAEKIARIGAWKVNPETDYLYWTEGVYEILKAPLDYRPGLTEGMRFYDAESVPVLREALGRALADGTPFVVETGLTNMAGEHVWTEVRGLGRLGEGEESFVMGTFQDISDRKRADAERMRLATAIEQAAEAIVVTDAQGAIQYTNPAFETITGYTREEALGQNPRLIKSGRHDAAFYRQLWETLARGEVWRGRIVNRKKDGTLYEEEAAISPVRDAGGAIVNYVAILLDVTRSSQLEAQLLQAQKMEAVGQLAGGVAHDFNNLLHAILGQCEFLLESLDAGGIKREDVLEIQSTARRAADLTRQLLAFSRKQMITPVVLDLNAVIEGAQKMLRRIIGEDVQIVLELANSLPPVTADATQVEQVIMNLAVNARDAMPDGGRLTIGTSTVELDEAGAATLTEGRPGRFVCLAVTDTGSGMPAPVLARIFEPFFSTKGPGKGTGLGLSVVYGIAKQHQGWISASSTEGRGSTFTLFLPAVPEPVGATEAATPPQLPPRGNGERILLVEDEAKVRELSLRVLKRAGYEVAAAGSTAEGLALFEREGGRFDLLFSDVVLPGENGITLAERLRERAPGLAVLLCSGYTDERSRRHVIAEKNIRLLLKPYPTDELLQAVHAVLSERRPAAC